MVTFLYDQAYECNEYCKFYKNIENAYYKFIPAVNRTFHDGDITHVTGIVNITDEDYERMPSQCDGEWLRANFPYIAQSMDRFIRKVDRETGGKMMGDLEIVRIPMELYHARQATSRPADDRFSGLAPRLKALGPYYKAVRHRRRMSSVTGT
jgi:hypothetical protein